MASNLYKNKIKDLKSKKDNTEVAVDKFKKKPKLSMKKTITSNDKKLSMKRTITHIKRK